MNTVDDAYWKRVDAMTIAERVSRAEDLFAWARGFIERQILEECGPLGKESLKWEVASRQCGVSG